MKFNRLKIFSSTAIAIRFIAVEGIDIMKKISRPLYIKEKSSTEGRIDIFVKTITEMLEKYDIVTNQTTK